MDLQRDCTSVSSLRLAKAGITFDNEGDVWALSCIGAWVGLVYNQCKSDDHHERVKQTRKFFKDGIFRDLTQNTRVFHSFACLDPIGVPCSKSLIRFLSDPDTYERIFSPSVSSRVPGVSQDNPDDYQYCRGEKNWVGSKFSDALRETALFMTDCSKWTEGDLNQLLFNHGLAINPFSRFIISMMFLSNMNGLARIYYPDSSFINGIDFKKIGNRPSF